MQEEIDNQFNALWQQKLFRDSAKIQNSTDFQDELLKICQSHGCGVRYIHYNYDIQVDSSLKHRYASQINKSDLTYYLEMTGKKLVYQRRIRQDQVKVMGPSNLWKEMEKDDTGEIKRIRAIVVGADKKLFEDLENYPHITVVRWPEREKQELKICQTGFYTFSHSDLYNKEEQSFNSEITETNYHEWIRTLCKSQKLLQSIVATAEYHVFGIAPVSYISIPIPLKSKIEQTCPEYFSIDIFWCGDSVSLTAEKVMETIAFVRYIASEITFPSEIESTFSFVKSLSEFVMAGYNCHDLDQWIENGQQILKTYAYDLLAAQLKSCLTFEAHNGLKTFAGMEKNGQSKFCLDALFALSIFHVFKNKNQIVDMCDSNRSKKNAGKGESCTLDRKVKIDYKAWSEFMKSFDDRENQYGDRIQKVTLKNDRLIITFGKEKTVENLWLRVHIISSHPTLTEHNIARAFYNAFLSGNNVRSLDNGDCVGANIIAVGRTDYIGNTYNPLLKIEFDNFNKAISIIVKPISR